MAYPPGVPTAEGIIASLKYAFQVYKEVRQAGQKYKVAKEILKSIDLTLCSLESLPDSRSPGVLDKSQVEAARNAWLTLERYLKEYEPVFEELHDASVASKVSKKLKWACNELDKKVDHLRAQIDSCLTAILPILLMSNNAMLQQLSEDVADLKSALASVCASTAKASSLPRDQAGDDEPTASSSAISATSSSCWKQRGGCLCRCHSSRRVSSPQNQQVFADVFGLLALFRTCNVAGCTRRDGLQLRVTASTYRIPWAVLLGIESQSSWLPKLSLTTETVCRYTSPGFMALEELQHGFLLPPDDHPTSDWPRRQQLYDAAIRQKVADIRQLFTSRQVSFSDVDPSGRGWLDKVLRMPWEGSRREAQWDLVEFLVPNSPQQVRANSKALLMCAKWIGEGPHMAMLETLLSLKIDPGDFDSGLFQNEWPRSCNPGWQSEALTPDPMFVKFIGECVRRSQGSGFAGCDALTESVLTDDIHEFERVLHHAIDSGGIKQSLFNALGQTALHLAIFKPNRLEKLLEAGMDPDAVDNGGSTPLMYAACYGQLDSVTCLLQHGADPGLVDSRNRRLFMDYAILRKEIHVIEGLVSWLKSEGCSRETVAVLDRCMCYYFGSGCHNSDLHNNTLKSLLALGADVDVLNGHSTMLHKATSDEEARMILKAGFSRVNSCDEEGITPLMKVASRCDLSSIKKLLKEGAAVESQDKLGWTTLHHLMHTWPSVSIVGTSYEEDDEQFGRAVRGIACVHRVIRSGGLVGCRDHCKCACSQQGCSAITIALHETTNHIDSPYWSRSVSGMLVDLMCILQNRAASSLDMFHADVKRYRVFIESGLEHSCCFRKINYYSSLKDNHHEHDSKHAAFTATFNMDTAQLTDSHTGIIKELSELFVMLEERSLKEYETALLRMTERPKFPRPRIEVDEAADAYTIRHDLNIQPQLSKLNIAAQKQWLSNVSRIEKSGGFDQRGTLQSYLEQCLKAWNDLETVMEGQRSSPEIQEIS